MGRPPQPGVAHLQTGRDLGWKSPGKSFESWLLQLGSLKIPFILVPL
jgi:hypothetical protein